MNAGNPSVREVVPVKGSPVNTCSILYCQTIKEQRINTRRGTLKFSQIFDGMSNLIFFRVFCASLKMPSEELL